MTTTEKTETTGEAVGRLEYISVGSLLPHPLNPRGEITPESVCDLVESIKNAGLLSPLVVRRFGVASFEILAGHRRFAALKAVALDTGREDVPCLVRELDDAAALVVMLTENNHREDVDPMREARCVEALMDECAGDIGEVAERLGCSVRWIASRRSLLGLSDAWQARFAEPPYSAWPVWCIEYLAKLSPEAQDEFWVKHRYRLDGDRPSQTWWRESVADWLRVLGDAPFALDDAEVARGRGACTTCPKTSMASPGLFDDSPPDDLERAVCRDRACWDEKSVATLRKNHEVLEKRVGRKVLRILPAGTYSPPDGFKAAEVERAYDWKRCKKSDPGAQPAQVLRGPGARIQWVKRVSAAAAGRGKGAAKKTLADHEQLHAKKVEDALVELVTDAWGEATNDSDFEAVGIRLWPLLVAFGAKFDPMEGAERPPVRAATWDLGATGAANLSSLRQGLPSEYMDALWPGVRAAVDDVLMFGGLDQDSAAAASLVCIVMDWDLDELRKAAEGKVVPTKALVAARKAKAAKAAKSKKRKKAKGAKKSSTKKRAKKAAKRASRKRRTKSAAGSKK